jgi:16S rRNA (guanine966-N2)-methyltransferase
MPGKPVPKGGWRVRVIAGELRGRRLVAPAGDRTRPTAARVREALFDVLAPWVGGGGVLDLYAGSGALGIEALSRGHAYAWFVERAPAALAALRDNVRALGLTDRATVVADDVARFLQTRLGSAGVQFELVLADPPYALGAAPLIRWFGGGVPGRPPGLLALEHAAREELPAACGNLERAWSRTYGDTGLSIYRFRIPEA